MTSRVLVTATALLALTCDAFRLSTPSMRAPLRMMAIETDTEAKPMATSKLLRRDRYVATNRFEVRDNCDAKFEKRWATRKSRLATLDGFRYFQLMRRVKLNEDDPDYKDNFNYVSFTIWETKGNFNAWRKGDAFKEAHGGNSLTDFVGAMVSSLMVLKAAPRPAFYDGLLLEAMVPESVPETQDGWRTVEADGINLLPTECFVACNNFAVVPGQEDAFEKRWSSRETKLKECEGFVAFSMLRRDDKAKGHGTVPRADGEANYMSTTVWKDRASFDKWRNGQNFKAVHGQKAKEGAQDDAPKPPPLWSRPPSPVFYEAKLVISSPEGA